MRRLGRHLQTCQPSKAGYALSGFCGWAAAGPNRRQPDPPPRAEIIALGGLIGGRVTAVASPAAGGRQFAPAAADGQQQGNVVRAHAMARSMRIFRLTSHPAVESLLGGVVVLVVHRRSTVSRYTTRAAATRRFRTCATRPSRRDWFDARGLLVRRDLAAVALHASPMIEIHRRGHGQRRT